MRACDRWTLAGAILALTLGNGMPAAAFLSQAEAPPPSLDARGARTVGDAIAALNSVGGDQPNREGNSGKSATLRGNPGAFFGAEEYPAEAIRRGEEGRTVAKLWIDTRGKVVSCTVTSSSGSPSLDQKTCAIALERVTFTPPTDRRGRPIVSSYVLPVRWVLPTEPVVIDADAAPPTDTAVEMTLSIDSAGRIAGCHAETVPATTSGPGPCDGVTVGRDTEYRWQRGGRPVGGTVTLRTSQHVTVDP